jgi:hypothetical protein
MSARGAAGALEPATLSSSVATIVAENTIAKQGITPDV